MFMTHGTLFVEHSLSGCAVLALLPIIGLFDMCLIRVLVRSVL